MTFRDLIAIHRRALRDPHPVPVPADRRLRALRPRRRHQIFTDWASI